jgi:predicted alpha/beta hydrolase
MNAPAPQLSQLETTPVRLRALDGYELGGVFYGSSTPSAASQVAVLHAGAGIAAARYRRFASYLAAAGIPVLTYDYRGIGASRPKALRGFRAAIEDWAECDCAGAIAWLRQNFPGTRILGVAHSIAGLIAGGAPNSTDQARLVMIGAHTGYFRDYERRYRLPMTAVWHGLMPALAFLMGYFPAHRLGLGEDIPRSIALQWGLRRAGDLRPAPKDEAAINGVQRMLDRCASLQRPALVVSVSDDAFATGAGVKRLLSYYPRLFPLQHMLVTPADAGTRRIGHFGFFGRHAGAALWPRLLAQLEPSPN